VAIEDAEAPRRQHQHADAGKQHADDLDRQEPLVAVKTRRDRADEERRRHDADQNEDGDDEREQRRDRAGDAVRLAPFTACEERRVDRDERRGQRALAKQVLQHVRNPQRGVERVGGIVTQPEIMREHALADQASDPAEQNPGRDEDGSSGTLARAGRQVGHVEQVWQVGGVSTFRPAWPARPA
jgi:hypothetical protein